MESENKVAIGKTVMGTKEHLVTIRPTKECLLIETMYFLDEIKAIPKPFTSIETNQAELEMAKKLINNMTSDFKPELYKDEYNEKVKNAIQQKINGQEVTEVHPQQPSNVIDLMDALKRSVEASKKAQ